MTTKDTAGLLSRSQLCRHREWQAAAGESSGSPRPRGSPGTAGTVWQEGGGGVAARVEADCPPLPLGTGGARLRPVTSERGTPRRASSRREARKGWASRALPREGLLQKAD